MLVTYEDMKKAREDFTYARCEFKSKYYNFLLTILQESGFYKKLVKIKNRDLIGEFHLGETPYERMPWEIKFYPVTKSGSISMKCKYVSLNSFDESTLLENLKEVVEEVVGDVP